MIIFRSLATGFAALVVNLRRRDRSRRLRSSRLPTTSLGIVLPSNPGDSLHRRLDRCEAAQRRLVC